MLFNHRWRAMARVRSDASDASGSGSSGSGRTNRTNRSSSSSSRINIKHPLTISHNLSQSLTASRSLSRQNGHQKSGDICTDVPAMDHAVIRLSIGCACRCCCCFCRCCFCCCRCCDCRCYCLLSHCGSPPRGPL
ncbi:hypothetical protein GQ42DRAFT_42225 [Ramicandelaber brevisporus]|nr:hypothetical protein GQ42DRAFT_42225 [Ramicandelaber brevisporus]